MQLLLTIVVCLFAGAGAGLGTGFAGMSAAAVISPMLVTFLHIEPYTAVGIALASDVLASAVSAYTYGRNRNLDIRNGLIMMITVLCIHCCRQPCRESSCRSVDNGQFLRDHDTAARRQVHRPPRDDHERRTCSRSAKRTQ